MPDGKILWYNNNLYYNTKNGMSGIGELTIFNRTWSLTNQEISKTSSFVLDVPEYPDYYTWDCVAIGANISKVNDLKTSVEYMVSFGDLSHQSANLCIATNNTSLNFPTNLYPRYVVYNNLRTWSSAVTCVSRYGNRDGAKQYGAINTSYVNNMFDFNPFEDKITVQMFDIDTDFGKVQITGSIFLYCYNFT